MREATARRMSGVDMTPGSLRKAPSTPSSRRGSMHNPERRSSAAMVNYEKLKRQMDEMANNVLPALPPKMVEVTTRRGSILRGPPATSKERRESNAEMLKMFKKLGVDNKMDIIKLRGREDEP